MVPARVEVGRAGDVQRGGCRRQIVALGQVREMSPGEVGALGQGGEMGRDREVRVRFGGVRSARRDRCRLGRAID